MFDQVAHKDKFDAERKASQEKSFSDFMAKPETKLVISMIPASQQPEAMTTILRSAFDAGHSAGIGVMLVEMLTAMLKGPKSL